MKTTKIFDSEIRNMLISSLPSRPTAPTAFGGRGFTAIEMKEAFDKLPLYLVSKFNALIDDITRDSEDSILSSIPTGIKEGHSLKDLISDLDSGNLASYLNVQGEPLAARLSYILSEIERLNLFIESAPDHSVFVTEDGLAATLADYLRATAAVSMLSEKADRAELEARLSDYATREEINEAVGDVSSLLSALNDGGVV
jgi:hypothetical protein